LSRCMTPSTSVNMEVSRRNQTPGTAQYVSATARVSFVRAELASPPAMKPLYSAWTLAAMLFCVLVSS
jgi:hypothetical protein